jgi:hypothetical protein
MRHLRPKYAFTSYQSASSLRVTRGAAHQDGDQALVAHAHLNAPGPSRSARSGGWARKGRC